tara:strand:+ start:2533 stop:4332 length:1800 start_codon:yes stop_codon:yes gene_type:complete
MGAYEDIKLIRDNSGQILSQGISRGIDGIAKGIMTRAAKKAQLQKDGDAQTLKDQNTFLLNEEAFDNDFNNAKEAASVSKTPMMDTFEKQLNESINGIKNEEDPSLDRMGAKEARYRMLTEKNLSKEKQDEYAGIVSDYKAFLSNSKLNMGSLIGEKEEYKNFTRSDLGRKSTFKGEGFDKTRNMWTYLSLNNETAPEGVTFDKRNYQGEKGASMVYSKVTFDENSQAFKNLSQADQDEIRKSGDMSITFDQDWAKWREEGFLTDIIQGVDEETMQEALQFKNKEGALNENYVTTLDLSTGKEGDRDVTSQTSVVNTPFLMQGLYAPAENRASVVMDGTPQEQSDYIAFTLGIEGSDFNRKTTKLPGTALEEGGEDRTFEELIESGDAKKYLTKETQEQFLENNLTSGDDAGSGYVQREATAEEAKAINDLNAKIEGFQGDEISKGDLIYKASKDISSTKTAKTVADPLIEIRKTNTTILDNLYNFDDQKGASDFFKNKKYDGKSISGVDFVSGEDPASNQVTLTWDAGRVTQDDGDGGKESVIVSDSETFDLMNPARMDTLLDNLLSSDYTKAQRSKMRSNLQKQLRQRINKQKLNLK